MAYPHQPRYHPKFAALACVAVWLVQVALAAACWLSLGREARGVAWYFLAAYAVVSAALGFLLLAQLPRALRWQRRRSARPTPEMRAERQRIAHNLHDSVGAQLVQAMALLDPGAPAQADAVRALEQCLLELRIVVDSMDGSDDSLADRLARLRYRIQPVLERRGIQMEWAVVGAENACLPTGEAALHLGAIVQEALSNMLQHAHASRVSVVLEVLPDPRRWRLQVSDNGCGLPAHLAGAQAGAPAGGQGQGLAGMRWRAHQLGAQLQWGRGDLGGLCVRVEGPCA